MSLLSGLTENWLLKVVSLVFALGLWLFVMGERKLEVGFTVPLELQNVPQGLMVANEVPNLVDVRISGPRTLLMNLSRDDISITVDLKDLQPGMTSFKRLEERLNIPSGLRVTRLSPSFVDVRLERVKQKEVPVRQVVEGEAEPGFRVTGVKVHPERVTVEGAEGELKNVVEVPTEPIQVAGVRESFTLMVPLDYQGTYSRLKERETVEVRVEVEPLPEESKSQRKGTP